MEKELKILARKYQGEWKYLQCEGLDQETLQAARALIAAFSNLDINSEDDFNFKKGRLLAVIDKILGWEYKGYVLFGELPIGTHFKTNSHSSILQKIALVDDPINEIYTNCKDAQGNYTYHVEEHIPVKPYDP